MKQRKKPLLLITIVATLVVVLLGVNMSQYLRDPNRIQNRPAPNEEARKKMSERKVIEDVPEGMQVADMLGASSMGFAGGNSMAPKNDVPATPTIELPRLQGYTNRYQRDVISGQWWKENSKSSKTVEENQATYKGSQE